MTAVVGVSLSLALAALRPEGFGALAWAVGDARTGVAPGASAGTSTTVAPPSGATRRKVLEGYGRLPLSFEPNQGQVAAPVKFLSRGHGYTLFLTGNEAVLVLPDGRKRAATQDEIANSILRMKLLGANPEPAVSGDEQLPGKSNYLIGPDRSKWHTDIANYGKVRYSSVYPGIDLVYYGHQGRLEYDFVLAPGADPRDISLGFAGADKVAVDKQTGDLVLKTGAREVRFRKPVVYQQAATGAAKVPVIGRFRLKHGRVNFDLGRYDRRRGLVIDPGLTYSTFLGGDNTDVGYGIAVNSSGDAYIAGYTLSSDFPVMSGHPYNGGGDSFVTQMNSTGTALVYSTCIGGSGEDLATAIALDGQGYAYVAGQTNSYSSGTTTGFPVTTGAFQTTCTGCASGDLDGFVYKLNRNGSGLTYATYLGGSTTTEPLGVGLDLAYNVYVGGLTASTDFPVTSGVFQPAYGGGSSDGFVTKLNSTGTALVWSSFIGGTSSDQVNGIVLDTSGDVYVTGETASSAGFPITTGAFQPAYGGGAADAFVAEINSLGTGLVYSSYLGGSGTDSGAGLVVDGGGNTYVVGNTTSSNFPVTSGVFQTTCSSCGAGLSDAFVTKVAYLGQSLVYSTYLGGSGTDIGYGIALDSLGYAFVTGSTTSTNFPVTAGAFQTECGTDGTCNGGLSDGFITGLNPRGTALSYSTYLGGDNLDQGLAITLDSSGYGYVTGSTASPDFPVTSGAYKTTCGSNSECNGTTDAFVTKLNLNPPGGVTSGPDFDGDGKADISIWRPDTGTWWIIPSDGSPSYSKVWGETGDIPQAQDFDGDGETDYGIWRPSDGTWYIVLSSNPNSPVDTAWGAPGDVPVAADYTGDGKADIAVWRPSNGTFYVTPTGGGPTITQQWGEAGDIPVPGDYDGDGIVDFAVFRPSNGTWYYIASSTGQHVSIQWGAPGVIPVQGDYNGDGKTDFAYWQPSNATWNIMYSGGGTLSPAPVWGALGDIPAVGDYDGDRINDFAVFRPSTGQFIISYSSGIPPTTTSWGECGDLPTNRLPSMYWKNKHIANFDGDRETDIGVFRPSNGTWYVIPSSSPNTSKTQQFGLTGDVIAPGDYDGDGKTDYAVWRPSNSTWYVLLSSTGKTVSQPWGTTGDIAVPGDYDGDGKTDYAIWRPSTATWWVILSSTGQIVSQKLGLTGDVPVPADYDGDGKTDYAVWQPSNGTWYIIYSSTGTTVTETLGMSTDIPVPGDYDGDTKADITVFRPSNATWYSWYSSTGQEVITQWGETGDIPVAKDYDGDEKTDVAVFRPSDGSWYIIPSANPTFTIYKVWGLSTDVPVNEPTGQVTGQ